MHLVENYTMMNRRSFASGLGVFGVAAIAGACQSTRTLAGPGLNDSVASAGGDKPAVAIFAKHAQSLTFEDLAVRLRKLGVDGIEATLRPGGQIEPDQLEERLPGLVEALADEGRHVVIAASHVNRVDADTQRYLQTLSKHRIRYLRMAYYRYDYSRDLWQQLDEFASQARDLAMLCGELNITALYQNHAGSKHVGAGLWDLAHVLRGIDASKMAIAFDVRHAALEMSQSWRAAYAAIQQHVGATYVKDFAWHEGRPKNVPLGQGCSRPVFDFVQRQRVSGPISVHMEYIDHRPDELAEQRWQAICQDVQTFRQWQQ